MENQKSGEEKQPSPAAPTPTITCRKKKNEQATFMEDLKDHIDEFIHASMEEHVSCAKKTIQKVCPWENFFEQTHICITLSNHLLTIWCWINSRCLVCPRLLQKGTLMPQKKLKVLCPFGLLCQSRYVVIEPQVFDSDI